jgi:hypothetical protein
MCQLSIGHHNLNGGYKPHEIWYETEAFVDATVKLARRCRFDGSLVVLAGRPPNYLDQNLHSIEETEEGEWLTWCKIPAGDVVEEWRGWAAAALEITPIQRLLDLLLMGGQIIQGPVEVVLVEGLQGEHFADGVIGSPTHGRETRALMDDPSQDEEPSELG